MGRKLCSKENPRKLICFIFTIKKIDMRTKIIDENSISCIPEDADDLIILRRVIKKGDRIVGETVRVIKQEKDFARPD